MKPRLLDLFCGAGGAAMGYARAGFEVVGVDVKPQPRFPFEFRQRDALDVLGDFLAFEESFGRGFDAIHASPPCQAFTKARKLRGYAHPELLEPVRDALEDIGLPYVIENVPGAPLLNPTVLCGEMFGLGVYRHRLFETTFPVPFLLHGHGRKQAKMGRRVRDGEIIQVVGNFAGIEQARSAMGIDWMTQRELAQAIPPAFTEFIGAQLLAAIPCA